MATSSFPATRWSVIAAAGAGGDRTNAQAALAELCRAYWYPLYAFARRSGLTAEDAEDATQAFFLAVLEDNLFAQADPALGRLRSFLLKAFSRDLSDARRDAGRLKRGGGVEILPLAHPEAEARYQAEPEEAAPALQFEKSWALAVLAGAAERVEADYQSTGRGALFAALRPFLGSSAPPPDATDLARSLNLNSAALRQAISRLRERFRLALRAQIADTLQQPTEAGIDDELRALRAVLTAG